MRGDDRLMTILTGVVLAAALGAVAYRTGVLTSTPSLARYEPRDDVAAFPPGLVALIDVVANDAGAAPGDGARLLITRAPACGAAWRKGEAIAYLGSADCPPEQSLRYCVAIGDACPEAELRVRLDRHLAAAESASGSPVELRSPSEEPAPGALAALAPTPPAVNGFTVEGVVRPDRAPFAAIGLPFAGRAEAGAEAEAKTD